MNNFLLIKFNLDRKWDEFIQNNIFDFENIGFEVDDPIEKKEILSHLPEWEITDIQVIDDNNISYGVYFEDTINGQSEKKRLMDFLIENVENIEIEELFIDNSNWEEEWKKSYRSFEIGNKILVKPSWEDTPSTDRIIIEIDPKMAFGTGTHETTALCMENAENFDFNGKKVLDIGCGSGILSILAMKMGAKIVDACDIDPIAIDSTKENAVINGVKVNAFESNLFSNVKEKYDLIFANILAEILIEMLDSAHIYLEKDGVLILSGIIDKKEEDVLSKLKEMEYQIIDVIRKGEWSMISARRKNA